MRVLACVFLLASAASAGENDLQLWRLGHPDALSCTFCDGRAGDVPEPGSPGAQPRFHRFASTLGLAFVPPFEEPAATTGQAGFEIGFSSSQAFLRIPVEAWPTVGTQSGAAPPGVLVLPAVVARKGLGGSLELGFAAQWLAGSQMMALSGEVRWAAVEGVASAPDLALRLWGTRVVGTEELDLAMAGADLLVSKGFGVAGTVKLQPYGSFGIALINAQSGVVDFKPATENAAQPGLDDQVFRRVSLWDNRYLRAAAGVRLAAGPALAGVEAAMAWGRNDAQDAAGTSNFVRLWSVAGRLGLSF